jgi:hypothetical protein
VRLSNPAADRTAALAANSDETRAYLRMMRSIDTQHNRDLETLRSLVRALTEPRGLQIPLVCELKVLLKQILEECTN